MADNAGVRKMRLDVALEEFRNYSAGITTRIDLQQRNANLNLTILAAITGFLVNFWSDHGRDEFVKSEVVVLVVVMPLVSILFVWRHLDHDFYVVDQAWYLVEVVRPVVVRDADAPDALSFERFLAGRRATRQRDYGRLSWFANDSLVMIAQILAYLAFAWDLRLSHSSRAGTARTLFDALLYASTVLLMVTVPMIRRTAKQYGRLGEAAQAQVS